MSTWKEDVVKALENLGGVAHISSIHKGKRPFKCSNCAKEFVKKEKKG